MRLARADIRSSQGMRRRRPEATADWRPRLLRTAETARCIDWLRDRGSLTTRIEACGEFAVERLGQTLALPLHDECGWVAACSGRDFRSMTMRQTLVRQREVLLRLDGTAVVFAHTILPLQPRGVLTRWFQQLGSRSLGRLLFSHPGFMRGMIEVRRIDARHSLYRRAAAAFMENRHGEDVPSSVGQRRPCLSGMPPGPCWARRSTFYFGRQRVLVTEVFVPLLLPAMPRSPDLV